LKTWPYLRAGSWARIIFSRGIELKITFILTLLIVLFFGCSTPIAHKETRPSSPREDASAQLTQEGQQLLQAGHYDNAIRLLEQAIGLNPDNGQSYYYLAQAWLKKGMVSEAKEFNSLARIYLQDDKEWLIRVENQANQISKLE
jgi:tetratricopeptide (TPR) repeat protein